MSMTHWLAARPIAHRGLHDRAQGIIENTAGAFNAAVEGGYPIECDLQLTGDGDAVVFHDDTLDRLTDTQGWLKERNVAELKKVNFRECGDRIQTLAELLAQVRGRVPLVIELKSQWDGNTAVAGRALEVLKTYEGPHCLMSFDPEMIEKVRELSPSTIRGIVAERAEDPYYHQLPMKRHLELRTLSHLARTRPHFISFYFRELPFGPIAEFRGQGNPVVTWTIRSREEEHDARRYSDQITFEGYIP
jgi:glycerophosphoryl diester phosphodiesterase